VSVRVRVFPTHFHQFRQHASMDFPRKKYDKLFLVQKFGRTANMVWQISAHNFGLNFVGEIEQQFFFDKLCDFATFFQSNKVWWNQPAVGVISFSELKSVQFVRFHFNLMYIGDVGGEYEILEMVLFAFFSLFQILLKMFVSTCICRKVLCKTWFA